MRRPSLSLPTLRSIRWRRLGESGVGEDRRLARRPGMQGMISRSVGALRTRSPSSPLSAIGLLASGRSGDTLAAPRSLRGRSLTRPHRAVRSDLTLGEPQDPRLGPRRRRPRAVWRSGRLWRARSGGDRRRTRTRPRGSISSRNPLFEQTGGAMNLQGRRIAPHRICRRALAGQRREDPVEGADPAPADDAVPARLRRPADGRRVAPRQPAPDARNDPEDHPPVLPPRHAARRVRQRRLQAGEPGFGSRKQGSDIANARRREVEPRLEAQEKRRREIGTERNSVHGA